MALGLTARRRSSEGFRRGGRPGPENTYGIPQGAPLRDELKRWFRRQKKDVLDAIPKNPIAPIPFHLPPMADYNDPMARAFVPILSAEWDAAGRQETERLGLDPATFNVQSPELRHKVETSALALSRSTNAATGKSLDAALTALRAELVAGLVDHGEADSVLADRVAGVFELATRSRAERIAVTESSRAYHGALDAAAEKSGVVAGLELLLSGDACPLCRMIATEAKRVKLGQAFAVIGSHPDYSEIRHPPLHPNCQCSLVEILTPEYGGPENPDFRPTLIQPKPGKDWKPPEGFPEAKPEPVKAVEPVALPGNTPEIRAAYARQRAENRAVADATPEIREDVETWSTKYYREQVAERRADIARLEKAMVDRRAEWEKVNAEWIKLNRKADDWSLTKPTRAKWAKRVAELRPKWDELDDIFRYGPHRIEHWKTKSLPESEANLAAALAHPDAVRVNPYGETRARFPDVIPPGPIGDRVGKYHAGAAKVKAITEAGDAADLREAALEAEKARIRKAIDARFDKQNELVALAEDPANLPAHVVAEYERLEKEITAMNAEFHRAAAALDTIADHRREAVLKLIEVRPADRAAFPVSALPDGFDSGDGPLSPIQGSNVERIKTAQEWLSRVVAKGDTPDVAVKIGQAPGRRAHHGKDAKEGPYIQLRSGQSVDVIVHEFGHAIDDQMTVGPDKGVRRSYEFLNHRVGDEKPVDMKAKYGYGDAGEMGRKDEFTRVFEEYAAHYTGKDYGRHATEILSMGLQLLYEDPVKFARNDPEFCAFILGMADGSLR